MTLKCAVIILNLVGSIMNTSVRHIIDEYSKIDATDHQKKVAFYEDHFAEICLLNTKGQSYFKIQYVKSLFDLGRYNQVLALIDELIELVFYEERSEEFYATSYDQLIFIKACAHYNLNEMDDAVLIADQLLGISSGEKSYHNFYRRAVRKEYLLSNNQWQLGAIILLLISGLISGLSLLKMSIFSGIDIFYFSLFINAMVLGILAYQYAWSWWSSRQKLSRTLDEKTERQRLHGSNI